ncbi:hypothetical protein LTR74_016431 [Friedmanniomyces endolithicus]|nr:hypothetical protein LTR74_016431 [Friedmanniomyces endolithicus]
MLNLNLNLPSPRESTPTSRQAKRRSLLPQFARSTSGEQHLAQESIPEDEGSRADSAAGSTKRPQPHNASDDADRKAMPPPSKLGRPFSVFGAIGLGRAASTRSPARDNPRSIDARADALAALTGSAPSAVSGSTSAQDSGLKRTSSTRLPQSPATRGLSRTASVKPKDPGHRMSTTLKPTTTTSDKRSSIIRPRPPPIDSLAKARPPSISSPISPAHSTTSRHSTASRPSSQLLSQPPRPSFSTYQQHYSPAKSALPKPPIPAPRTNRPSTVPAPDENPTTTSPDIQRQQNELLTLSLLHQTALHTLRDYTTSAHRQLNRTQTRLRREADTLHAQETEQTRLAHLAVLEAWCPNSALLAENLRVVGRIYVELTSLSEKTGRFARLVWEFEGWIWGVEAEAEAAVGGGRDGRIAGRGNAHGDALGDAVGCEDVGALPREWRKMHNSLSLRLRGLQRELGGLPPAPSLPSVGGGEEEGSGEGGSGLGRLLEGCGGLVGGMLRELEVMGKLERGVLEREERWVEEGVKGLLGVGGEGLGGSGGKGWVPAWQSVA